MELQRDNVHSSKDMYKEYVLRVLLITGLFIFCVMGLGWFINPFGVWESPRIHGINRFIDVSGHVRLYKMFQIPRQSGMQVCFLGSSTVFKTLYPRSYYEISGLETYNGGFSGARISEMRAELEQAIKFNYELKEVILGLNWFMFHQNFEGMDKEFPKEQVGLNVPTMKTFFASLLSWESIKKCKQTLWRNLSGVQYSSVDADGKLNENVFRKEYDNQKDVKDFAIDTIVQIPLFQDYQLSEVALNEYASMVALCEEHGIELRVYINPVHGIFLESIYEANGGEVFENWKRRLAEIHPVYDFAHYSKVGNEPFSLQRRYWRNTQHPMPLTGDLVLRRLAGKNLPDAVGDFGFLLTMDNVESVLENERRFRDRWRKENADTVQFVNTLIERY